MTRLMLMWPQLAVWLNLTTWINLIFRKNFIAWFNWTTLSVTRHSLFVKRSFANWKNVKCWTDSVALIINFCTWWSQDAFWMWAGQLTICNRTRIMTCLSTIIPKSCNCTIRLRQNGTKLRKIYERSRTLNSTSSKTVLIACFQERRKKTLKSF